MGIVGANPALSFQYSSYIISLYSPAFNFAKWKIENAVHVQHMAQKFPSTPLFPTLTF